MTTALLALLQYGKAYGTATLSSSLSVQHLHFSLRRNNSSVDIQFTPNISIFATSQYKENQLFTGHISSALWKHNIADMNLPMALVFELVWDAGVNKFVLTMAA